MKPSKQRKVFPYLTQMYRNNVPAEYHRTYYRRCISVPLVDRLLVELDTIFSPHRRVALLGLCMVPLALVTQPDPDVKSHLSKLVKVYEEYLASPESVSHQMVSWKIKWQQQMEQHDKACLPSPPSQALPHATSLYQNIQVLLLVLCTLPVIVQWLSTMFVHFWKQAPNLAY